MALIYLNTVTALLTATMSTEQWTGFYSYYEILTVEAGMAVILTSTTHSKCCFISDSSAYLEIPLTNKVRFTCMEKKAENYQHNSDLCVYKTAIFCNRATHQVILFVVHLGGVPSHAVHCQ